MSNTIHSVKNRAKFLLCVFFLAGLTVFYGCGKRQRQIRATDMDVPAQFMVRVLLLDNVESCMLKIDSGFSVSNPVTQITTADFDKTLNAVKVTISNKKIDFAGWSVEGSEITILPQKPHIFTVNGDEYRGNLKIILNADSNSFDAINLIPLEPYLAGVIGAEMPDYWELEALKAQTIAARSYCMYIKKRFGSNRNWDLKKTQANQAYHGVKAESERIWQVINQTVGKVLTCGYPDGTENILPAYYSSICGGHTESSISVFGGESFAPLAGVPCSYCRQIAKPDFFHWKTRQYDKTDIADKLVRRYPKLKELGKITKISVARKTDYDGFSRLTLMKLHGVNGKTDTVRAEDFRLTIDPTGMKLKSTIFKIVERNGKLKFDAGRGFGHGVGLCQCGAEGLARKGKKAEQILYYYYPESKIVRIY